MNKQSGADNTILSVSLNDSTIHDIPLIWLFLIQVYGIGAFWFCLGNCCEPIHVKNYFFMVLFKNCNFVEIVKMETLSLKINFLPDASLTSLEVTVRQPTEYIALLSARVNALTYESKWQRILLVVWHYLQRCQWSV